MKTKVKTKAKEKTKKKVGKKPQVKYDCTNYEPKMPTAKEMEQINKCLNCPYTECDGNLKHCGIKVRKRPRYTENEPEQAELNRERQRRYRESHKNNG